MKSRLLALLLFFGALAPPGYAASFRCDGNVFTDHPIADQHCVELSTNVSKAPEAAPSAPLTTAISTNLGIKKETIPYVRPAPLDWKPAPLPDISLQTSALPKDAQGRPMLGNGLSLDTKAPRGPTQVLAGCSGWISGCYQPGERSLDQCWVSVPACKTADGLEDTGRCCPTACVELYEARRKSGDSPSDSSQGALFHKPSCFPEIDKVH
jgi:hypothetical protein